MRASSLRMAALFALATAVGAATPDAPVADAAMENDLDRVVALIEGSADVNQAQGDGMTGLHWAARHENREMVAVLLEARAAVDAVTRVGEHTPLHVAATIGAAEVMEALLDAGADPESRTTNGAAPLHFAAASGDAASIRVLVGRGADANATEPRWGQTPLMFAAAKGRAEAVSALLELGARPDVTAKVIDVQARADEDQRARAARQRRMRGEAPIVESPQPREPETHEEIERRGGEPEPLNYSDLVGSHGGLHALHLAVREGHTTAVEALLEGGADIDQPSAADGTTPLLLATINGYFDLAMRLLEMGADPSLGSDAGAQPLYATLNMHWAPKARHPQPTVYLQQETSYLELMTALLDAGVDPNARLNKSLWYTTYNRDLLGVDRSGATPFWRAAYALDIEAMKLLLTYGADPGIPTVKVPERRRRRGEEADQSGLPPVPLGGPAVYPVHAASGVGYGQGFAGNSHRHAPDGWLPAVRFLVEELGADVNARDHKGYSPVHHAAARGDNELILYLVEQGADVTAVARNGQTTVDMANGPVQRVQPYEETVRLLESLGAKNNHNCVSC